MVHIAQNYSFDVIKKDIQWIQLKVCIDHRCPRSSLDGHGVVVFKIFLVGGVCNYFPVAPGVFFWNKTKPLLCRLIAIKEVVWFEGRNKCFKFVIVSVFSLRKKYIIYQVSNRGQNNRTKKRTIFRPDDVANFFSSFLMPKKPVGKVDFWKVLGVIQSGYLLKSTSLMYRSHFSHLTASVEMTCQRPNILATSKLMRLEVTWPAKGAFSKVIWKLKACSLCFVQIWDLWVEKNNLRHIQIFMQCYSILLVLKMLPLVHEHEKSSFLLKIDH